MVHKLSDKQEGNNLYLLTGIIPLFCLCPLVCLKVVLGPLLFLVYINDLPQYPDNCKVFLFADDTKCCHQIQSFSDISDLQASINQLSDWSMKWRLHFNDSKCVVMTFHSSSSSIFDYDYKIGSNFITTKF